MTRQKQFSQKIEDVQDELEKWAILTKILKPGERIVFSMRIENVPTVVQQEEKSYELMPVTSFFSIEKLHAAGIKSTASRIRRYLPREIATMSQFLGVCHDVGQIKDRLGIRSKKILRAVVGMMTDAGFPVTDHDGILL